MIVGQKTGESNTVGHTFITLVVVSFCGAGMLEGKIPVTWFLATCAVVGGWVPIAVFVGAIQLYLRALHMAPPGSPATAAQSPTPPAASDSIMPPPGIVGLFLALAGAATAIGAHASAAARFAFAALLALALTLSAGTLTGCATIPQRHEAASRAAEYMGEVQTYSRGAASLMELLRRIAPNTFGVVADKVTAILDSIDSSAGAALELVSGDAGTFSDASAPEKTRDANTEDAE